MNWQDKYYLDLGLCSPSCDCGHCEWRVKAVDNILADMKQEIIAWCDKRCDDNIKGYGTDKWNGDMEDLIEFLKR